jgi:hypothetical protein
MRLFPALAFALACGATPAPKEAPGTGALLSVDLTGDTDVVGFHFRVEREACSAEDRFTPFSLDFTVDLMDGYVPAEVDVVEQRWDSGSRHLAADLFTALEVGCYRFQADPASQIDGEAWTPSGDCASAHATGVQVENGLTTEVLLISQCQAR